jgi:hypothetical protein
MSIEDLRGRPALTERAIRAEVGDIRKAVRKQPAIFECFKDQTGHTKPDGLGWRAAARRPTTDSRAQGIPQIHDATSEKGKENCTSLT